MNTENLKEIGEQLREHLAAKHRAREEGIILSRDVVRHSANAIRAVHRREFEQAEALIEKARDGFLRAQTALSDHRDILYAGFLHDGAKEYVEASCTLALIAGRPLPSPEDLGVEAPAYLNGLAEAIGELRRHLLDALREGDIDHCEQTLAAMGDIYDVLVTMDFPEGVTSGLRHTTDAMRAILERTRGDFTTAYVQHRLEQRLRGLGS